MNVIWGFLTQENAHTHPRAHRGNMRQILHTNFFSLGHMKSTQRNKHLNKSVSRCVSACLKWTELPCSEGENMRNSDNFTFHVVTEYSFAIFVSEIFHLRVCVRACMHVSYYFASRPSGMCRFQKNSSSIFMWVYAFINVAANCLRSNSQLVSASTRVYLTDRETKYVWERESYQRGREMERTKRGLELLQMALCFQQMKRRLWKKKGKDHTDEGRRRRKKGGGQEKKERLSRKEKRRELSSKGICPTLVWLMNPKCPESVLNHRRPS